MSEIKYCPNCAKQHIEHTFQDTTYGKYNRVFNPNKDGGSCTVCGDSKKHKK